jgi:hypothetical protein
MKDEIDEDESIIFLFCDLDPIEVQNACVHG